MAVAQRLLWLFLAGGLGTLARYGISAASSRWLGNAFPWGTLLVNILGCFLFGWIWTLSAERKMLSDETRLILLTGFMGALTTFSTYAFETADSLRKSQPGGALANLLAENALGLAAILAGCGLARWK